MNRRLKPVSDSRLRVLPRGESVQPLPGLAFSLTKMKTKNAPTTGNAKKKTGTVAETPRYRSREAEQITRKAVTIVAFEVPQRGASLLPKDRQGFVVIQSAEVADIPNGMQSRINNWQRPHLNSFGESVLPTRFYLPAMRREGCDTLVETMIETKAWKRIEHLAMLLMVSPAEWLLACAGYNAAIEERCG